MSQLKTSHISVSGMDVCDRVHVKKVDSVYQLGCDHSKTGDTAQARCIVFPLTHACVYVTSYPVFIIY